MMGWGWEFDRAARAALVTTLLLATGCDPGPVILQDTEPGEMAYRELSQQWVQWAMALPFSTGPITDATGASCDLDQSGKVWFLAGTTGGPAERSCTIPRNKALFFPLINRWIVPPDDTADTPEEMAEYLGWAEPYFDEYRLYTCELTLRLDGEDMLGDTEVLDEELYVKILDPFEIELNDDNWATQYGKPGGTYSYVLMDGHYALLPPLEPGDHVLEFGGTICDETQVYFETFATYELHVEG